MGGARKSSGYKDLSTSAIVWAGIGLVLLAVGMAIWLLRAYGGGTDAQKAQLEAIKTAGTIVVGTGGAAALWLAARRQQTSERVATQTDHDAAERRVTELYTKAVEQLGSDKAPVRLGGMYALERLAQNVPEQRQTIVNVLCAYLRMPYLPSTDGEADKTEVERRQQERHARLTAQRILAAHLDPGAAGRYWEDIDIDLTGATLLNLDFRGCRLRTAQFVEARFCGPTDFRQTRFDGEAWFDGTTFEEEADFESAEFAAAAWFRDDVEFAQTAWFNGARFRGPAGFNGTRFCSSAWFSDAEFAAATAFDWVEFRTQARFKGARFGGASAFSKTAFHRTAWFDQAKFARDAVFADAEFGEDARFIKAEFGRDVSFKNSRFKANAWFGEARFSEGAWFRETDFIGAANFDSAVFGVAAWFDAALFGGSASFGRTRFDGVAGFEKARVKLVVDLLEGSVWPAGVSVAEPFTEEEARVEGKTGRWGFLWS
ncbi:pentapeptide repeat-containing protein [Lentzea sp. CA-135723]|uniref:pentapeptide repeat-containing protein n=1 Tax=Lentzea sp. CA-135723 TaxID=3239950 RepID=UPI003D89E53E